jgi:hypothetical protein
MATLLTLFMYHTLLLLLLLSQYIYIVTAAALIADAIGEDDLRKSASEQLAPYFSPWLDGTNADALLYDTEWGAVSHCTLMFTVNAIV